MSYTVAGAVAAVFIEEIGSFSHLNGCPPFAPVQRCAVRSWLVLQTAVPKTEPNGLELATYGVRVFQHGYHQIDSGFFVQGAASVSPEPFGVIRSCNTRRRGEKERVTAAHSVDQISSQGTENLFVARIEKKGSCGKSDGTAGRGGQTLVPRCFALHLRNQVHRNEKKQYAWQNRSASQSTYDSRLDMS